MQNNTLGLSLWSEKASSISSLVGRGQWSIKSSSSHNEELEEFPHKWLRYLHAYPSLPFVLSLEGGDYDVNLVGTDLLDEITSHQFEGISEIPQGRVHTPYVSKLLLLIQSSYVANYLNDDSMSKDDKNYIDMMSSTMGIKLKLGIPSVAIEYIPTEGGKAENVEKPDILIRISWRIQGANSGNTYLSRSVTIGHEDTFIYGAARLAVAIVMAAYAEKLKREEAEL